MSKTSSSWLRHAGLVLGILIGILVVRFLSAEWRYLFRDDNIGWREARYVDQVLYPALVHASESYPAPSVRIRAQRLVGRIIRGEPPIVSTFKSERSAYASVSELPDGRRAIYIFTDRWMEAVGNKPAAGDFEDLVVLLLLHEEYHVDHHIDQELVRVATATPEQLARYRRFELEAWWDGCTEVFLPAFAHGRFHTAITPEVVYFGRACIAANGDPNHPVWQEFINAVSNDGNPERIKQLLGPLELAE